MAKGIQGSIRPHFEGNGTSQPRQPFEGRGYAYGEADYYHRPSDWTLNVPYTGRAPFSHMRSDQSIHEDVLRQLKENGQIDATDLTVEVLNGEVLLSGKVKGSSDLHMAEDLACNVPGVKAVHNQLETIT